jgi:AcrR family transcriptional regulator
MTELRDRIIAAAYPLITQHGVRGVSVAEVIRTADVSASDLQQEFPTFEQLAAACLARREEDWTFGLVESGARARGTTPEGRLLALFDVFDEWFRRDDYEACTFITVLLEMGNDHPLGHASVVHLANIRRLVASLAEEAQLVRPEEFARSFHILMQGSIVGAAEGDQDAALRAQVMAASLIAVHRPVRDPSAARSILDDLDLPVFDQLEVPVVAGGQPVIPSHPPVIGELSQLDPLEWSELGLADDRSDWI